MLQALIASIGYAGGVTVDKIILSKYKVPIRLFNAVIFAFLAIITAVFLPLWGNFTPSLWLKTETILLFILMIVIAVTWNVLYARSLQQENLHEFELIMLLSPLVTIIMAEIFLPSERNLGVFIAGIVASLAFLLSRFRGHHLVLTQKARGTLLAMLLMSAESIVIKMLLPAFSPVTLYFVRTLVIAAVFLVIFRPKSFAMRREGFALLIISAIFGVTQMVLKFYGFQDLGVIETTMILLLGPIFVYIFSYFFFQEKKLFAKDAFSASVIVVCILYITFFKH